MTLKFKQWEGKTTFYHINKPNVKYDRISNRSTSWKKRLENIFLNLIAKVKRNKQQVDRAKYKQRDGSDKKDMCADCIWSGRAQSVEIFKNHHLFLLSHISAIFFPVMSRKYKKSMDGCACWKFNKIWRRSLETLQCNLHLPPSSNPIKHFKPIVQCFHFVVACTG